MNNHYQKLLIQSILAGFCIGLGGTIFLLTKDIQPYGHIIGALLFTIGLFTICTRNYALFTGKACYTLNNSINYFIDLIIIWTGNLLGCMLIASIENLTTLNKLQPIAQNLVTSKFTSSPISLFLLGFLCNIFIYIAVDGFKNNKHEIGKYLSLIFGVSCFIIAGTEHSIADMYYLCMMILVGC